MVSRNFVQRFVQEANRMGQEDDAAALQRILASLTANGLVQLTADEHLHHDMKLEMALTMARLFVHYKLDIEPMAREEEGQ